MFSVDDLSLIQLFLISLPEALLITALGFQLVRIKLNRSSLILIGVTQAVFAYFVRLCPVPFGLHSIIEIIVFILILRVVTGIGFRVVTITALLGLTIYLSLETVIAPTLLSLTGYALHQVMNDSFLRIAFFLPEAASIAFFIFISKRYDYRLIDFSQEIGAEKEQKNATHGFGKPFTLYILMLLPVLLMALLNLMLFVSQTNTFSDQYLSLFVAVVSLVIVIITFFSMGSIKKISQLKEKEFEAQKAGETIVQLDKLIRAIRKQRHDFNHHLQTLYGLLEVGECQRARDYVRKIFLDISPPAELVKTDNPGITAMLYAKAGLAETRGVHFQAQVECSLKDIPLTTMEMNSLLGNLLDNAIEAADAHSGSKRLVTLEISQEQGEYRFIVTNTGTPIPPQILHRLYDWHFTTKGKGQGLGLPIAKEITEKYSGNIEVAHRNHETVFTVHIPDKG